MFLDYPSNGQNIQAWKLLGRLLHLIVSRFICYSNSSKQNLVEPYWKSRCKSWNVIHFNLAQICQNEEDLELVACKVTVLSNLEHDNIFTKEVLQQLPCVKEFLYTQNSQNQQFTTALNLN
ncbi:uncharacterized protein LOC118205613 isoform X2 [Stegodyphus dumicola]|uniref:uncharacterized protein LOC118205613 isoform X2 n=1 Tax=Stegodyphus dumicola TaxID=202533 RepID=UPI0015AFD4A0|nr:uncharacterized protein LOC118205613 isoform X2 [Stegodyphus dumicola]